LIVVSGWEEHAGTDRDDEDGQVDLDSVVRHTAGSWSVVDERVVVRSSSTQVTCALDPVSSVVWRCLDGASTLGDVLEDIADAFAVPVQRATAEMIPVVRSWVAAGLVDLAGAATPTLDHSASVREEGRRWRHLVDPPNG
jgi:hypothetical protein